MVRIWASMLIGALVLVLSFQNCSEQEAAQPASNGVDLPVEDNTADEPEVPAEEPVVLGTKPTHLLFGYDEVNMTFKYSLALTGTVVTATADDSLAKNLTNDERAEIIGFFANQIRFDVQPHDANRCAAADYAAGTYAEVLTDDPNKSYVLNLAAFDCGGSDFADGDPLAPTRITIDVGGMMMSLKDILDGHVDSVENPPVM